VKQTWPRLATCACGDEILVTRGVRQGHPFRLDVAEVLPLTKCGYCHGTGHVTGELRHITTAGGNRGTVADGKSARYALGPVACAMCNGTGIRGQDFDDELVLVSAADGIARPFAGERSIWEAAHRRHQCALAAAA
jgi:hypothetical protein